MANRKKISELDIAQSISGDDLFVVVDPNRDSGNDSSSTGKTNKVTLNTIKNSMFPAGAPIQFWNQNSNNIFFDTGNVGIGTDSPNSKLDVEGTITSSGLNVQGTGTTINLHTTRPNMYSYVNLKNTTSSKDPILLGYHTAGDLAISRADETYPKLKLWHDD